VLRRGSTVRACTRTRLPNPSSIAPSARARSAEPWTKAGRGESEGFELAEQALIENTSHGDQHTPARLMRDARPDEESAASEYGEPDGEHHAD
jgi:hypothetical protein